jgi:transposase-like protein
MKQKILRLKREVEKQRQMSIKKGRKLPLWSTELKKEVVKAWKQSGMTKLKFGELVGIRDNTLGNWIKKDTLKKKSTISEKSKLPVEDPKEEQGDSLESVKPEESPSFLTLQVTHDDEEEEESISDKDGPHLQKDRYQNRSIFIHLPNGIEICLPEEKYQESLFHTLFHLSQEERRKVCFHGM